MKVDGRHFRSIWLDERNPAAVNIIDQRRLPHELAIESLQALPDFVRAISEMHVRGAPLIGVTAAFGVYIASLSAHDDNLDAEVRSASERIRATRPTAKNLEWAVGRVLEAIAAAHDPGAKRRAALDAANSLVELELERCRCIGLHGVPLIEKIAATRHGAPVNILTHCNAGWLACVDYGTATAPIYEAASRGIPLHVWVDETRPRNQGASLTAWELLKQGVPHTLIVDNAGGHLMQHGLVDLVIVGSDRTTRTGDVANKIGTYLKALAARDNDIPFYAALPSSSIDWELSDGVAEIPIEERDEQEVRFVGGSANGVPSQVLICPPETHAGNYAFDVTPARLVTGLITERGVCDANERSIAALFPELVAATERRGR